MTAKPGERFTTLSMPGKGLYKMHICERELDANGLMSSFLTGEVHEYKTKADAVEAQNFENKRLIEYNKKISVKKPIKKPTKKGIKK